MKISICATGDNMHLRPFPCEYDYTGIASIIQRQDVRITNLETVVSEWNCYASTYCGGQWINTEPDSLDDFLKWGGINLISAANNHSMDYSYDGLRSTITELDKRGLAYAGIGESLDAASKARIIKVPNSEGKIVKAALISVTSTFIDAARAGNSKGTIPARPGINPLRIKTKYYVTKEHLETLKEIAASTYLNGERDNARRIGSLPPEDSDSLNFGGLFFAVDIKEHKKTTCDQRDLKRILAEIHRAKIEADYVIVSVHTHQIKKGAYYEPDYFQEEFAHACIDNGASAVIGGGTHQLKPIEIYKGKPVFYSLGNFCFQSGMVKKLPDDFWDKYSFPIDSTVSEALNIKTKNGTVGLEYHVENYLSVIPIIEFENDCMSNLSLVPIDLGFELKRELKGLPRLTDEKNGRMICRILDDISKNYGTTFKYSNRIINVEV